MNDLFPTLSVNEPTVRKPRARVKSEIRAGYNAHGNPATDRYTPEERAVLEQAWRIIDTKMQRGPALTEPAAACEYCVRLLAEHDSEVFAVLFLDTRHRIIAAEKMFFGTIDGAEVHPRDVVKRAIAHNAAAVVLTHNHPSSGNTEPSAADRAVTARLRQALMLVDVRVLDHIIVSGTQHNSMARSGQI